MKRALPVLLVLALIGIAAWFSFQKKTAPTGASLYHDRGCAGCHGEHGEGTDKGPSLAKPSGQVPHERMEEYLKAPSRVLAQSKMPAVPLTDEEARMLAEHVDSLRRP